LKRKKCGIRSTAQHLNRSTPSDVGLGFGKTNDWTAFFPLTAFLEQFHALETFQDVSFRRDRARPL
jgi:hypothetical protein